MLPTLLKVSGLGGMKRSIAAFAQAETLHPKEPHYYLLAIGVDPSMQGKGVGSSLLAPMAERLDREGIGAYLESSKERNLPLYERFGFKVTNPFDLKDGPRIWPMWRAPS
jgi:ribosomal protein S18 acetylase RimI-like enzyme